MPLLASAGFCGLDLAFDIPLADTSVLVLEHSMRGCSIDHSDLVLSGYRWEILRFA